MTHLPDWAWQVSDEEYYAPNAPLGSSALSTYLKSPLLFHDQYVMGNQQAESKALDLGKAVHLAALEPSVFLSTVVVQPASIKRRSGKTWEKFRIEHKDKLILTQNDFLHVRMMADNVRNHPEVGPMLEREGYAEVSYKWEDKTGLACKARFDMLLVDGDRPVIVDLKTTRDVFDFPRSFARYYYHCQAAHYRAGVARALDCPVDSVRFVFAAIDKSEPFPCVAYEPDQPTMEVGVMTRREALEGIARSFETHDFTDPRTRGIQPLSLPGWATPDIPEGLPDEEEVEEEAEGVYF